MLSLLIGFKRLIRCLVRCFNKEETKALLVATGIILLIGTIFYHNIEKMTFIDSFYFSFVTLATIGYGDLHPITTIGKLFTVLYGILGLGMVSLSVGVIARELVQIRNENQENNQKNREDTLS
ncbi:potassium channel family protein [Vagococcus carniphilus]|uniref:potassium channel family protein n=1 Tax=Vagococcus carniphilus TaxID=218144 RepID=UPI00288D189A|nr:potassium channel family protein [Vagococcus carniphilus]MDT2813500.1 potassium channel family protein [Vagococcus carniphilus]MDT2850324.1 potassium channel family protein [Vagococcus carniphilus]MDT2865614.1 potassium channel family protein [Vagococcus carniphilus]